MIVLLRYSGRKRHKYVSRRLSKTYTVNYRCVIHENNVKIYSKYGEETLTFSVTLRFVTLRPLCRANSFYHVAFGRLIGNIVIQYDVLDLDLDNTRRRLCRLLPRCRQRLAPPIAHWGI